MEITIARRLCTLTAALLLLALSTGPLPGLADAPTGDPAPGSVAPSSLAGGPPARCAFSSPGRQVCSWSIEGRLFGASPAGPQAEPGSINLVCELALDEGGSGEPLCRAHPVQKPAPEEVELPPVAAPGPSLAGGRPHVIEALQDARTMTDLSHAIGDVPTRCLTGARQQTCVWLLMPGTSGHARLALALDEPAPVVVRCNLPLDGSPRAAGSCAAATLSPDA